MTDQSLATVEWENDEDGRRPAIRLLVREALMISRRLSAAAEGIECANAGKVLASARSIVSEGTRLGTIAGLVVHLIADFDRPRSALEWPQPHAHRLSFPPYELDLVNDTLLRDGTEIPVQAKQFCILRYMADHPQRLVRHGELKEAVWGPNITSESLLRTHVRSLRKAIGQGIISTVIGRGYRFVPTVTRIGRAADPAAGDEPRATPDRP